MSRVLLHQSSASHRLYTMQRNSSEAQRHDSGLFNSPHFNPTLMNHPSAKSTTEQKKVLPDNIKVQLFFWSRSFLAVLFFNWPCVLNGGKMRDHRGNGVSILSPSAAFRIKAASSWMRFEFVSQL